MADLQKVNATVTPLAWTPDAYAALFDASLSPFGPLASAGEIFAGCDLYIFENNAQRCYVATRTVTLTKGTRLDVVGARSIGSSSLNGAVFADAVNQIAKAHQASLIGLMTKIPKIAEKCKNNGFEITGAVMLKAVT